MWDRYRRGERNIFTRRLYTLQGQQTFEEIRRRYRRDADFRETVDRYIQEFERLIADVDREDRSGTMTKTYLTAKSGKVYTILAHAAGGGAGLASTRLASFESEGRTTSPSEDAGRAPCPALPQLHEIGRGFFPASSTAGHDPRHSALGIMEEHDDLRQREAA